MVHVVSLRHSIELVWFWVQKIKAQVQHVYKTFCFDICSISDIEKFGDTSPNTKGVSTKAPRALQGWGSGRSVSLSRLPPSLTVFNSVSLILSDSDEKASIVYSIIPWYHLHTPQANSDEHRFQRPHYSVFWGPVPSPDLAPMGEKLGSPNLLHMLVWR